MRAAAVVMGAAAVQLIALIIAAMFIESRWPRNVYPYVRYPQWIDSAMFGGLSLLAVTILVGFLITLAVAMRDAKI